jgi:hypothetical protein
MIAMVMDSAPKGNVIALVVGLETVVKMFFQRRNMSWNRQRKSKAKLQIFLRHSPWPQRSQNALKTAMAMGNAVQPEHVSASQGFREMHARIIAQIYAVAEASAQTVDACAWQVSLVPTAQSRHAAVVMEIAQSLANACVTQGGWVDSARLE